MSALRIAAVTAWGASSGLIGYMALERLLNYTNTRAAAASEYLSRNDMNTSLLDGRTYQTLSDIVNAVPVSDYCFGLLLAAGAGLSGAMAIYNACKKE